MWPWGHAALGYLLYTAYTRRRYGRPPDGPPTLLLLFGTQLPDLIDKPLAWTLPVLPSGRSLGHSLLFLVPFVLIVAVAVRDRDEDEEWAGAFAIGALSHAVVDVLPALVRGALAYTTSLVWPLLPPSPYDERDRTILGHFLSVEPTPMVTVELGLALVALVVWWRQGRPGLGTIRAVVANRDR